LTRGEANKMEKIKLAKEREDLGSRLYYCSTNGEGRKIRKEIEKRIREINRIVGE
jgi:hypothetical protein